MLYRLEGSDDEALAEIDRAIRVDPLSPRNYFVKGHTLLRQGLAQRPRTISGRPWHARPTTIPHCCASA